MGPEDRLKVSKVIDKLIVVSCFDRFVSGNRILDPSSAIVVL